VGLLFFLALAGCAGAEETEGAENVGQSDQAIQGGYGDLADRAVVGLAITDGGGNIDHTCSGALIAPNLVLTAQHCIASTSKFVHCGQSVFGPPTPPHQVYVTLADSMWGADTEWIPVAQVLLAPGDDVVCGRDVALLLLSASMHKEATPLTPRLDSIAEPGEPYSAVGFGESAKDADDAGLRRRRDHLSIVCVGHDCGGSSQVEPPEWRGDHGICNGDSGGPAIDSTGRVIGITSRGPQGCDDPIYGGLTEFKGWLRDEAVRAARVGHYPAALWTRSSADDAERPEQDSEGSACALHAGRPASGAPGAALLALAALALFRRRA
jgi:hypothetical protein